jgi:hypothetical protein
MVWKKSQKHLGGHFRTPKDALRFPWLYVDFATSIKLMKALTTLGNRRPFYK